MSQITTPLSPSNIKSVTGRIKVLSQLDLAEKMLPQDGRMLAVVTDENGERKIDIRVSILPSQYGENIVLRLLDPNCVIETLDQLGLDSIRLATLRHYLKLREGIILVTGPSGSGKTTTLYTLIKQIASPECKVLTVENPIEYDIPKVSQHQISSKVGFADYTKAFLRHDPDVIVIGEIRDSATALLAVRAAMTGHLVIATLHTNDAVSSITRLRSLGVDNSSIADTVKLVLAQRLVRKTCPACREKATEESLTTDSAGQKQCDVCQGKGLFGRIGIFELLCLDTELRERISTGADIAQIRHALGPDHRFLLDDAKAKIQAGIIAESEADRIVFGLTEL